MDGSSCCSSPSSSFSTFSFSSSSTSELISLLKFSFRETEFSEVESILVRREEEMRVENENLKTENGLLIERIRSLTEGLNKNKREADELREQLVLANQDKNVLYQREKRVKERCNKFLEETLQSERRKIMFDMNKMLEKLSEEKTAAEAQAEIYRKQLEGK